MTSQTEQHLGELVLFPMERVEKPFQYPSEVVRIADCLHDSGRTDESLALLDSTKSYLESLEKYQEEFPHPAA